MYYKDEGFIKLVQEEMSAVCHVAVQNYSSNYMNSGCKWMRLNTYSKFADSAWDMAANGGTC